MTVNHLYKNCLLSNINTFKHGSHVFPEVTSLFTDKSRPSANLISLIYALTETIFGKQQNSTLSFTDYCIFRNLWLFK